MTNKATIKVPDVSGMSESEAVKKLQDAGFVISEQNETISSSESVLSYLVVFAMII